MRNLNYFAQFLLCPRCEKPFTVVSPDKFIAHIAVMQKQEHFILYFQPLSEI